VGEHNGGRVRAEAAAEQEELCLIHQELLGLVRRLAGEQKHDVHSERFPLTPDGLFAQIWEAVLERDDLEQVLRASRAMRLEGVAQAALDLAASGEDTEEDDEDASHRQRSTEHTKPDNFTQPLRRLPKGHFVALAHAEEVLLDRTLVQFDAHYDELFLLEEHERLRTAVAAAGAEPVPAACCRVAGAMRTTWIARCWRPVSRSATRSSACPRLFARCSRSQRTRRTGRSWGSCRATSSKQRGASTRPRRRRLLRSCLWLGPRSMFVKNLSAHANVATSAATVPVRAGLPAVCNARAGPAAAVVPPQIPAAQTLSEDDAAPEDEDDDEAYAEVVATRAFTVATTKADVRSMFAKNPSAHANVATSAASVFAAALAKTSAPATVPAQKPADFASADGSPEHGDDEQAYPEMASAAADGSPEEADDDEAYPEAAPATVPPETAGSDQEGSLPSAESSVPPQKQRVAIAGAPGA
jgi:hypothetical protein